MMRWENLISPSCKTTVSSSFGLPEGEKSSTHLPIRTLLLQSVSVFLTTGILQSHGAGQGVSQLVGVNTSSCTSTTIDVHCSIACESIWLIMELFVLQLRPCGWNNLGENQSASENYPHRKDWSLAQPREGALSGVFKRRVYTFSCVIIMLLP